MDVASDGVVIDTIAGTYVDHLPLYPQSVRREGEAGVEIHRATLDACVMRMGELPGPVVPTASRHRPAMRQELLAGGYIQADETPVAVEMHDGGRNGRAWLWQYSHPRGYAVFGFPLGRTRDDPREFLAGSEVILWTDGCAACGGAGGPKMGEGTCWAAVRGKFFEGGAVGSSGPVPGRVVARTDELFGLEAEARARGRQGEARQVAVSVCAGAAGGATPGAGGGDGEGAAGQCAGKAAAYALGLWPKLVPASRDWCGLWIMASWS